MVLCLLFIFLAVNFDWSIILIRKSFGASRHISEKLLSEIGYITSSKFVGLILESTIIGSME